MSGERCHDCDLPLATAEDCLPDGCPACEVGDPCPPHDGLCWSAFDMHCAPVDWRARALAAEAERDRLRAASRALAGIDAATLDAVTPAAMRAVMERRGWTLDARLPWFADRNVVAFESWEHPTAQGAGSRGGSARFVPDVRVAVLPGIDAAEARRYVAEWAWSLATRHGDVSPAEVLAEALAAGVSS